jgi:hypothetical protein
MKTYTILADAYTPSTLEIRAQGLIHEVTKSGADLSAFILVTSPVAYTPVFAKDLAVGDRLESPAGKRKVMGGWKEWAGRKWEIVSISAVETIQVELTVLDEDKTHSGFVSTGKNGHQNVQIITALEIK